MALATLGIDRAIAFTILNRAWGLAAGPLTLIFIVAFLSPVEQGFYYVFTSMLGLQVFFELGLGYVVMQTVSHMVAGLQVQGHRVVGDDEAVPARLGRLLFDVLRWYGATSLAFVAFAWIGGAWFLGSTPGGDAVAWQQPWLLVVLVFGLSIVANACFSFLEGMGFVADVALARLVQALCGMLGLWLMLAAGMKLMSMVALHGINLVIAVGWILWRRGPLLHDLIGRRAAAGAVDWRREIWPFQWRIAASWIAGYFGTQAITLILFARVGPVEAGRFGLTMTVLAALASGAAAWLTTKAPRFGALVAQHRHDELDALYGQALRGALAVGAAGALVLLAVVAALDQLGSPASQRFIPMAGLAAMALATLANIRIGAQATYLRAFRREPFLTLSIVLGVLQSIVAAAMVGRGSLVDIALGYSVVVLAVGLSWAHAVFVSCRRSYLAA